jgi:hypothetical protein
VCRPWEDDDVIDQPGEPGCQACPAWGTGQERVTGGDVAEGFGAIGGGAVTPGTTGGRGTLAVDGRTRRLLRAVEQARAEFAALQHGNEPDIIRPRPTRVHERASDVHRARLQTQQRP